MTAAGDLIRRDGLHALSLRRLASHLGVTAPALYAHVADKRDLLRAVAEVEFDRLHERFAAVEADNPLDRIRAHCRAYVDHARDNPELFSVMFLFPPDLGTASIPDGAELPAATRVFTEALTAVQNAIDAGAIASADPLMVSLTLWTATHGVATALQLGFGLPREMEDELVTATIERLLAGWAAPLAER